MTIEQKEEILADLGAMSSQEEKFKYLIDFGRNLPPLTDDQKIDKYKVEGCTSQLWLVPELEGNIVRFSIDSDAAIPKGLAGIIASIFSGSTVDELITLDASFLKEVGIEQHLSMNRRNGLSSLCKQIQLYAIAYKQILSQ